MEQNVRVRYGNGIADAVLLEEVQDGILKGWCKLRMSDGHECYMAKTAIQSADADWRSYLKNHWDKERNFLRTDCLEDFMKVFIRAHTNYIDKRNEQVTKDDDSLQQSGEQDLRLTDKASDEAGGHRTSNAHVQLSLFPDIIEPTVYDPKH